MDGAGRGKGGGAGAAAPGGGRRRGGAALARLHGILEGTDGRAAVAFQVALVCLISANVAVMMAETEDSLEAYDELFVLFETCSVVVFTAEYAARLISSRADPRYAGRRRAYARCALSPMMLIDLAAILPFYLPLVLIDIRFIRVVRLLRLFGMFKLARYSEPLQTLGYVFRSKMGDLTVAFFIFFIVLVFASSLMYYAEHEAQPEVFSSIPASLWWGIVTLTTIGYGDTYPVTVAGKAIGAAVAVIGLAIYAIPLGIMASAFTEELRRQREEGAARGLRRRGIIAIGGRVAEVGAGGSSGGGPGGGTAAGGAPSSAPPGGSAPPRCPHCGHELGPGEGGAPAGGGPPAAA